MSVSDETGHTELEPTVLEESPGLEESATADGSRTSGEEHLEITAPENRIAKLDSQDGSGEASMTEGDPERESKKPKRREKRETSTGGEASSERAASKNVEEGEEEVLETLSPERLQAAVEALLFASGEPLSLGQLHRLVPETTKADLRAALDRLRARTEAEDCGYALAEQGKSFRLLTRPDLAPFVTRLRGDARRVRLSKAAFETLAVIAYRQPMKRADIDAVRGVQSGAILRTLMEWNLVRVIGRDDEAVGRPLLYGTTEEFLEQFGLPAIEQLPDPEDFGELAD